MPALDEKETRYRSLLRNRDTIRGGIQGLVVGGLAGKAAKKVPHGLLAGAATGSFLGRLSGEERALRDELTQGRQDARWDSRHKKAAFDAIIADSAEKTAFLTQLGAQLAKGIGQKAIGLGTRAAAGIGAQQGFKGVMQGAAKSSLGGKNLARNVGYGVMGAGALGVAGAGYAAGS